MCDPVVRVFESERPHCQFHAPKLVTLFSNHYKPSWRGHLAKVAYLQIPCGEDPNSHMPLALPKCLFTMTHVILLRVWYSDEPSPH